MKAKLNRIKRDIETIATFTSTPSSGVTRLPFTPEDKRAKDYIREQMIKAGLKTREDGVGTLIGKRDGLIPNAPCIILGSHYDSVKNGGAFDGVAGLVAALEVARILKEENTRTNFALELVAMNDEEGVRFNTGMFSSRAMVGNITEKELDEATDESGVTVRSAMKSFGIIPNLNKVKRDKDSIRAYLELHIEQGPVLETSDKEIGIVENIVGLAVYKVRLKGKSGHAGTTPMNLRADALLAASRAVLRLNSIAKEIGGDVVATVGDLKVIPSAPNVIPGIVEFTIDVRSSKSKNIENCMEKFNKELNLIEIETGIKAKINKTFYAPPVEMSPMIKEQFRKETLKLGYKKLSMNSGAGHDAMVMAELIPTGMIFVPSKDGISHTPEEWTDYEQIQKGVMVLLNTVIALDKQE